MRESIGSGLLFNIVITFVIILIGVLISSLAYSKAYRVKNRIIDIIEDNYGFDSTVEDKINDYLREIGYRTDNNRDCPKKTVDNIEYSNIASDNGYNYCIYKIPTTDNKAGNYYYIVTTYTYLNIPVSGESSIMYDTYINIET